MPGYHHIRHLLSQHCYEGMQKYSMVTIKWQRLRYLFQCSHKIVSRDVTPCSLTPVMKKNNDDQDIFGPFKVIWMHSPQYVLRKGTYMCQALNNKGNSSGNNDSDSTELELECEIFLKELKDKGFLIKALGIKGDKNILLSKLMSVCYLKNTNLLKKYNTTLAEYVEAHKDDLTSREKEELSKCFDRILNYFSTDLKSNYSEEIFEFMKQYCLASERTYSLMVRFIASQANVHLNTMLSLINEMRSSDFEPTARTYFPVLIAMIEQKHWNDAHKIFSKLKLLEVPPLEENHRALLDKLEQIGESTEVADFRNKVFEYHRDIGYLYGPLTKYAIKRYFQRIKSGSWYVKEANITREGMCLSCNTQLEKVSFSEKDLAYMKTGLSAFLKAQLNETIPESEFIDHKSLARYYRDLGKIVKDREQLSSEVQALRITTLERLSNYLRRTGPYDIVVDMLNLGYTGRKGFNAARVEVALRELLEDGYSVLGLCAGPLREYLLKTNIRLQADDVRLHKMVQRLKRWGCGLFFVGNSKLDDLYIIYAILHHNFSVRLLTEDRFDDHLYTMDKFAKAAFRRWMKMNVVTLDRFEDDKPIFKFENPVDPILQRKEGLWHFPLVSGGWICCQKGENKIEDNFKVLAALRKLTP